MRLTNSIENAVSGDVFDTDIFQLSGKDIKQINKAVWQFNWQEQLKLSERETYKLVIKNNPKIIQGLISLSDQGDHIYMHLIESAPFNLGRNKIYVGIPGNLVAFACRIAFHRGFEGYVSFTAKTMLIEHYQKTLGAKNIGGNLMVINTEAASRLIDKYFKN